MRLLELGVEAADVVVEFDGEIEPDLFNRRNRFDLCEEPSYV